MSLSIRNQEKVLYKLITLCNSAPTKHLYRPVCFEENFRFISANELDQILSILEDKEYIRVSYADLPNSFNIHTLSVTPKGLNYNPQKQLTIRERWCERIYGFIFGSVLTAIVSYFIPIILSHMNGTP